MVPRSWALVLGVAATLAMPTAAAAKDRCHELVGGTFEVENAHAWVMSRYIGDSNDRSYWGCLKSGGRRFRLTTAGPGDGFDGTSSVEQVRSTGRYAAYVKADSSRYGDRQVQIVVFDLKRSALAYVVPVGEGFGGEPGVVVQSLAVDAHGYTVWQTLRFDPRHRDPPRETIDAHDSAGTRELDSAPRDVLSRLTLAGRFASWSRTDTQGRRSTILG